MQDVYIHQIGDVAQIINFIESHEDRVQNDLWADLVEFSVTNNAFLSSLLDYVGICRLVPGAVISKMEKGNKVDHLRTKILRIFKLHNFMEHITVKCNDILEEDTLESLRKLNQGQRRAVKVKPNARCLVCAKPLFMPPGSVSQSLYKGADGKGDRGWAVGESSMSSSSGSGNNSALSVLDSQIWGLRQSMTDSQSGHHSSNHANNRTVVVFANRQQCHKSCLDRALELREETAQ